MTRIIKLKLYRGKVAFIELEIIDKSPWINAILSTNVVPLPVSDELNCGYTTLKLQASENAPSHETGFVTIRASVEPINGLFGLRKLIDGFEYEANVYIAVA